MPMLEAARQHVKRLTARGRGAPQRPWPRGASWLLPALLLALAAGCAADGGLAVPFLPTPTPSATPTATATATATPSPTPTPTPTPAPPPLQVEVAVAESVPQGGVLLVQVSANYPITSVKAQAAGRAVPFDVQGTTATGLLGFRSDARTGVETLTLQVVAVRGEPVRTERQFRVAPTAFPVERIQITGSPAALLAPAVLNAEWARLQTIAARQTPERRWEGPFVRPVPGRVTSAYGSRRAYNDGPPGSPHEGVDLAADEGEIVVAAAAGVVVVSDTWDVRGEVVGIDHGLGVFSGYYHLSERLVSVGEQVVKGQPIGRAGSTGLSTGPHVHWDVIAQGANTSPLEWTQRVVP